MTDGVAPPCEVEAKSLFSRDFACKGVTVFQSVNMEVPSSNVLRKEIIGK